METLNQQSNEQQMDSESESRSAGEESDSDDSDSDNEQEVMAEVKRLNEELSINCYDYTKHVQLIEKLESSGELELLRAARERMANVYPLTPKLWLNWINDEIKVATTDEDKKEIVQLFDRAVDDYVSIDVWLEYVQFCIGFMQTLTVDGVRKIFERSLTYVGLNVDKGVLIWDTFREFEKFILQTMIADNQKEVSNEFKSQIERVFDLFKRQLSIPLIGMDNTLKECEDWCQMAKKDFEIDLNLDAIKQNYGKAFRELEKLIPYEESLKASEAPHLEQYLRYIEYETVNGSPNRVQSIYERALIDNCLVPDLWIKYTNYLDKKIVIDSILLPIYERAVRNCTWSSLIWINYIRALERLKLDRQRVIETFETALQAGFQEPNEYLQLWLTYLDWLRRKTDWTKENEVKSLRTTFEKANEHLVSIENADPNCLVVQYLAKIEAKFCKNIEKARQLWNELMSRHELASQAQNWICFSRLERIHGDDKHYRKVLMRGLTTSTDWPESVGQILLEYEREEGSSIESFEEVLDKYDNVVKKINQKRAEKAEKELETKKQMRSQKKAEKYELKRAAKRKAETVSTTTDEKKTDSDGFKVPQTDSSSTPKKSKHETNQQKSKASDKRVKESDKESTNREQPTHGVSYKGDGSKDLQTIFVSNLDFKVNENQLKEAFEKFGKIDDIRLVRNYKGLSKGYAYIEYSSEVAVREALKHDRMPLEGRPVFISEVGRKKSFKFSTAIERHKVFVKNLAPEVTNDELKTIFQKYGLIKDARLVTYRNGHSKGCAYIEFEDESSAKEAVKQADGLMVANKNIIVAISNPNAKLTKSEEQPKSSTEHQVTRPSRSKINAPMIPTALRIQRLGQNGTNNEANGSNGSATSSTALSNDQFRELLLKK